MRSGLGGPVVRWQWGEIETVWIWSMAGWFWYWVRMPGCCLPSSGDRLVLLWGSIWCAGACAVISGVIVSPAGIYWFRYWFRIGSINSFGSGSGSGGWLVDAPPIWCDDMHHRYALPIWCDDMVRRYARHENRKGQEHIALGPWCCLLLWFVIVVWST